MFLVIYINSFIVILDWTILADFDLFNRYALYIVATIKLTITNLVININTNINIKTNIYSRLNPSKVLTLNRNPLNYTTESKIVLNSII